MIMGDRGFFMKIKPVLRLLAAVALLALPVQSRALTVTLAADPWCPYTCAESGFMVEIAREIFKKNRIEVDYRVIPWKEALEKARTGEIDGVIGATHDDAPDFIYPQSVQGLSDTRFWVAEDSEWVYSGVSSLENIVLGVIEDYAYTKELNDYIKANTGNDKRIYAAKGNNALAENISKLTSHKINVIAEDYNVIQNLISNSGKDMRIKSAGSPVKDDSIGTSYLYVAFSPANAKSRRFVTMMDEGMKQLRESGELKKILDIYHVNDWYGITKK